jgi:PAS domain S-box-containing protein
MSNGLVPYRARLLIRICALFIAGVGFVSFLGWSLGLPVLASLGSGMVPVAPSTALMFGIYAIVILFSTHRRKNRALNWIGVSIIAAGTLLAVVLLISALLGIQMKAEHLGFYVVNKPGELQIGHMSPVTAFLFFLSSLSYLLSLPSLRERRWAASFAWWLSCGIIATATILVLAYLYGKPMLYGSSFIPPAALTSLAFMALGAALLFLAAPQTSPSHHNAESTALASNTLILVFVLLATGIVISGFLYYRQYEMHYRTDMEHQLSAIADLKADELVQWRKERLGDAELFYNNSIFSELVQHWLHSPWDKATEEKLRKWIQPVQEYYQYDQISLLDVAGRERMSLPEARFPLSRHLISFSADVLRMKRVTFQDFYRNEYDGRIYLAVLVPILDERDSGRAIAALVLRIDPEKYIYPFINLWPTLSTTAETLIVRRDGDNALFLNELRFQKNTALNLRESLDKKVLPAAQAILGRTGVIEGSDYRNVPVLADVRAISGSPWFMVARMDISEVYGPLREKLWTTVALITVLLLSAGAAFGFVWRRQLAQFYQMKYEATAAMRASEVRYRRLFEASKDGILILDAGTGMVMDVNPFLSDILGYSHEAILGKKVWELGSFKDIVANQANFEELRTKKYIRYEDLPLETADGRRIDVEFVSNVYLVNQRKVIQCNIRDISERKRFQDKLKETLADLQRSNKELEQFAYVASHDLQEPLRMVASYTQLLAERYENQLDDKAQKFIHYAVDGAVRMQQLINDLLAYSRIGTRGKAMEPVDAHAALGEAMTNLKMNIDEANVVITNDDLPALRADTTQLALLFQNLIGNAVKFHGSKTPHIHISANDEGSEWLFSVTDNGIGIEQQYADKIFIIFQRLHTREEYPGSGIGLAICKKIVERHGGRIWFESELGKGSTFYFAIPK